MFKNPLLKWTAMFIGASIFIVAISAIYYELTTSPSQKKFNDCVQRVSGKQVGSGVRQAQELCLREQ
jgi:hypothetical protein